MKNGVYSTKYPVNVVVTGKDGTTIDEVDVLKVMFMSFDGDIHIISIFSKLDNDVMELPKEQLSLLLNTIRKNAVKT